ncbi:Auxin responsive protein [Musa troglodytarum]|uniref:Auxin responsive protein n=1 Tax=Musa troglodytarum TaxID=320322 RepID=A0A9E7FHG8_9LILI|nr:Auxin responsive protein [Musa troglodytarum]
MSFLQLGMAHHHERKEKAGTGAPPTGCMAVRVGPEGEEQQRLVVPVAHLSHPLFAELLDEAAAEYGFSQAGPIAIPCGIEHFRRVQDAIDREIGGGAGHHQHHNHHHHHHHHHHYHLPHFAGCFGA